MFGGTSKPRMDGTFCILCSENIFGRTVNGELLDLVSERREQYCLALVLQVLGINADSFFDVVSDWGANDFTFCKPCGRLVHRGLLMIDELKRLKHQLEDLKQQVVHIFWRGLKPEKLQRISYSKSSRDMLKQCCKPCTVKVAHVQLPERNSRDDEVVSLLRKDTNSLRPTRSKVDVEDIMPELDGPFYSSLDEHSSLSAQSSGSRQKLTPKTLDGVRKKKKMRSQGHQCSCGKIFPDVGSRMSHFWKAHFQKEGRKKKMSSKAGLRKGSAKSPKKQSGGGATHSCSLCKLRFSSRSERVQHHWDVHVKRKSQDPLKVIPTNNICLKMTPKRSSSWLLTADDAPDDPKHLQNLCATFRSSAKSNVGSPVRTTNAHGSCDLSFTGKSENLKHNGDVYGRSKELSSSSYPMVQLNGQFQQGKRMECAPDSMKFEDESMCADPKAFGLLGFKADQNRPANTVTKVSETICALCNQVVTWDALPSHVSLVHDLLYTTAGTYACRKCGDCYEFDTSIFEFQHQHQHEAVASLLSNG